MRGILAPAEFIAVAEETDFIVPLGEWVLFEACRTVMAWAVTGADATDDLPVPRVHVNVSGRQLGRHSFGDTVERCLGETGLPTHRLVLELTESQLFNAHRSIRLDLETLREQGVRLAADDFGTGFSTLAQLTDLPLDMLKVDGAFVAKLVTSGKSRAVVQSILGLGSSLSLDVVAEGVETAAQAAQLLSLGCLEGQGYYWRPALPAHVMQELVTQPGLVLTESAVEA